MNQTLKTAEGLAGWRGSIVAGCLTRLSVSKANWAVAAADRLVGCVPVVVGYSGRWCRPMNDLSEVAW